MSWAAVVYGTIQLSREAEVKWRALSVNASEWKDWPEDFYPDVVEPFRVDALLEELATYADDAWVRTERKGDKLVVFGKLHEDAYNEFSTALAAALRSSQKVGARGDVYLSDFTMSDFVWRVRVTPKSSTVTEADFEQTAKEVLPKAARRLEQEDGHH